MAHAFLGVCGRRGLVSGHCKERCRACMAKEAGVGQSATLGSSLFVAVVVCNHIDDGNNSISPGLLSDLTTCRPVQFYCFQLSKYCSSLSHATAHLATLIRTRSITTAPWSAGVAPIWCM